MKIHRSDFKLGLLRHGQQSRASVLRGTIGLTAAIALVVVLWAALTKPGRTSPSPSWQAALSLAEEGAQKAVLELQRMEQGAAEAIQWGNAGETPALPGERTFVYPNLKTVGTAAGSCRVTVSETPPLAALIDATGIVHNSYRTLAQRTLQVTVRRRSLFESAAFARKGLFVAPGAEVESERAAGSSLHGQDAHATLRSKRAGDELSPAWLAEKHPEKHPLPLLLPPWGLPSMKAVTLSGGDVLTLSDGGVFPIVSLLDSSRLIIDRDAALHITGPLILRGESRIVIACPLHAPATDARVRGVSIYVDKDVMVEEQAAIVNLTRSASSLSILGMEQYSRITLSTREPLYATIYAPNSEIRIGPETYLHGSVYGDVVHVLTGSRVHYDERLALFHTPLRPFAVVSVRER
ncbi:MAG: hypothetical protein Q8Q12_13960 [bacterium]|nr:hypothetical protein [bacterium]